MEHRTDTFQQHRQVSHDDISLDELEMSLPCKTGPGSRQPPGHWRGTGCQLQSPANPVGAVDHALPGSCGLARTSRKSRKRQLIVLAIPERLNFQARQRVALLTAYCRRPGLRPTPPISHTLSASDGSSSGRQYGTCTRPGSISSRPENHRTTSSRLRSVAPEVTCL